MRIALVNISSGTYSGGYVKHLQHLVPRLQCDARVSDLRLFAPEAASFPGVPGAVESWPRMDPWAGYPALRAALRRYRADVVFIPTARWVATDVPTVVMVRNMEPLTFPFAGNSLLESGRNILRRRIARRACVRATRIIAVSDFVGTFITDRWRIEAGRVATVHHGVDIPQSKEEVVRPASLHAMPGGPFLFTAGSIRPARGLEDVILAVAHLASSGTRLNLVIAGAPTGSGVRYCERMRRLSATAGVEQQVYWTGQLNARELAWGFINAEAFVMTSRAEACPNLALEALSHGARCISVNAAPMPEVFGSAAIYYPLGDGDSLARRLEHVLTTPWTDEDREAARMRAGRFSWDLTVNRTVEELGTAIATAP
jgi:glycosyltransferase involved in cell wall biosynthesis